MGFCRCPGGGDAGRMQAIWWGWAGYGVHRQPPGPWRPSCCNATLAHSLTTQSPACRAPSPHPDPGSLHNPTPPPPCRKSWPWPSLGAAPRRPRWRPLAPLSPPTRAAPASTPASTTAARTTPHVAQSSPSSAPSPPPPSAPSPRPSRSGEGYGSRGKGGAGGMSVTVT